MFSHFQEIYNHFKKVLYKKIITRSQLIFLQKSENQSKNANFLHDLYMGILAIIAKTKNL